MWLLFFALVAVSVFAVVRYGEWRASAERETAELLRLTLESLHRLHEGSRQSQEAILDEIARQKRG